MYSSSLISLAELQVSTIGASSSQMHAVISRMINPSAQDFAAVVRIDKAGRQELDTNEEADRLLTPDNHNRRCLTSANRRVKMTSLLDSLETEISQPRLDGSSGQSRMPHPLRDTGYTDDGPTRLSTMIFLRQSKQ